MITPKITNLGYSNLWTSTSTILGYASNFAQQIQKLFSNGEQGFAYDPNDLTTLYQDAAGTIPVTAAGQPVGLMLDKSKGLVLGVEKSSYASGFSSLTGIIPVGVSNSLIDGALVATSISTDGNDRAEIPITNLVVGRIYTVEVVVKGNQVNNQVLYNWTVGSVPVMDIKSTDYTKYKFSFIATAASGVARVYAGAGVGDAGGVIQVKSLSIKELEGNHAYQTVSASRPILQQTPILGNELVVNGSFSAGLTGWTNPDSGGAVTSASGGTVKLNANEGAARLRQSVNITSAGTYLVEVDVVAVTGGTTQFGIGNATSGDVTYGFFTIAEKKRYSLVIQNVAVGVLGLALITLATTSYAELDNITVKKIEGYRTDQNYLAFDGADDFLQTNNIDFTATDKVSLFAGVRKLTDAATGAVCELSALAQPTTFGSFVLLAPAANGSNHYNFRSFGSTGAAAGTPDVKNFPAPHSAVLRATGGISTNTCELLINGGSIQSTSLAQGTGNYGNYPLYIGRRGGTQLSFNGHIYSLIGIGRLTTDSETKALEKSIAKNVGVTLNV